MEYLVSAIANYLNFFINATFRTLPPYEQLPSIITPDVVSLFLVGHLFGAILLIISNGGQFSATEVTMEFSKRAVNFYLFAVLVSVFVYAIHSIIYQEDVGRKIFVAAFTSSAFVAPFSFSQKRGFSSNLAKFFDSLKPKYNRTRHERFKLGLRSLLIAILFAGAYISGYTYVFAAYSGISSYETVAALLLALAYYSIIEELGAK